MLSAVSLLVDGRRSSRRLRAAAFLGVAVWMFAGPFYRQVLGGTYGLPKWTMFHTIGSTSLDVTFYVVGSDGAATTIDRFETLGYTSRRASPQRVRLMRSEQDVAFVSRSLCKRLGWDTDLRARVRQGGERGWVVIEDGEVSRCK